MGVALHASGEGMGMKGGVSVSALHGVNDGQSIFPICISLSSILVSLLGSLTRFV